MLQIYIAMIVPPGILAAISLGVIASFYSEQFADARLRYSGVGFGRGLGTTLGGGLMPVVAASLMAATGGSTAGPIIWLCVILVAAVVAILSGREANNATLS